MNGWVVLLWSLVAALVIIIVGIFVSLMMMGRITLFPAGESSGQPAPDAQGVVDTSYSVLVLNATPETGLDVQLRETLLNNGWPADLVSAGPADQQDFAETTVYYVAEEDQLAAVGLADVIGGAQVEQSDSHAGANAAEQKQLVVVVGLDRSSVAPDSAETPAQ